MVVSIALAMAYLTCPTSQVLSDYRPAPAFCGFGFSRILIGEFGEERRNFTPIRRNPLKSP